MTYKIVVAGSRSFSDRDTFEYVLNSIIESIKDRDADIEIEIVSGGARGADRLGEEYAMDYGYELTIMNADWDTYGKAAGHIRNAQMADYCDSVVVFWDGVSRGSKNMIEEGIKRGKSVAVYNQKLNTVEVK